MKKPLLPSVKDHFSAIRIPNNEIRFCEFQSHPLVRRVRSSELRSSITMLQVIPDNKNNDNLIFKTEDGAVYVLGSNTEGCLGVGHQIPLRQPIQLTAFAKKRVQTIVSGHLFTIVVCFNKETFAFGLNDCGQLGIGKDPSEVRRAMTPTKVNLLELYQNSDIKSVVCGEKFAAFLSTDGDVFTVGSNLYGQLGLGGTGADRSNAFCIEATKVKGTEFIEEIAVGANHLVMLAQSGKRVYLCGDNRYGQLGLPPSDNQFVAKPFHMNFKQRRVHAVACGEKHTLLLAYPGMVFAFGSNEFGQLGSKVIDSISFSVRKVESELLFDRIYCHPLSNICLARASVGKKLLVWGQCVTNDSETDSVFRPRELFQKIPIRAFYVHEIRNLVFPTLWSPTVASAVKGREDSRNFRDRNEIFRGMIKNADVGFLCEDCCFWVEKSKLATFTDYFARKYAFTSDSKPNEVISVSEYTPEVLHCFFTWVYTGKIFASDPNKLNTTLLIQTLCDLCQLATELKEDSLRDAIIELLTIPDKNTLRPDRAPLILQNAVKINCEPLKRAMLNYIYINWSQMDEIFLELIQEAVQTEDWLEEQRRSALIKIKSREFKTNVRLLQKENVASLKVGPKNSEPIARSISAYIDRILQKREKQHPSGCESSIVEEDHLQTNTNQSLSTTTINAKQEKKEPTLKKEAKSNEKSLTIQDESIDFCATHAPRAHIVAKEPFGKQQDVDFVATKAAVRKQVEREDFNILAPQNLPGTSQLGPISSHKNLLEKSGSEPKNKAAANSKLFAIPKMKKIDDPKQEEKDGKVELIEPADVSTLVEKRPTPKREENSKFFSNPQSTECAGLEDENQLTKIQIQKMLRFGQKLKRETSTSARNKNKKETSASKPKKIVSGAKERNERSTSKTTSKPPNEVKRSTVVSRPDLRKLPKLKNSPGKSSSNSKMQSQQVEKAVLEILSSVANSKQILPSRGNVQSTIATPRKNVLRPPDDNSATYRNQKRIRPMSTFCGEPKSEFKMTGNFGNNLNRNSNFEVLLQSEGVPSQMVTSILKDDKNQFLAKSTAPSTFKNMSVTPSSVFDIPKPNCLKDTPPKSFVVPKTVSGFETNQSSVAPTSPLLSGSVPGVLKETSVVPKTVSGFEANQSSVVPISPLVSGTIANAGKETSVVPKTVSGFEANQSSVAPTSALISRTVPNALKETSVVPKTVSGFETNQSSVAPTSALIIGAGSNVLKETSVVPKTVSGFEANQSSIAPTPALVSATIPGVLKETSAVSKAVSGFEANQSSVAPTSALVSGTVPAVLKENSVAPKAVSGFEANQSSVAPTSGLVSGTVPAVLKETSAVSKTVSGFEANQSSVAPKSVFLSGTVPNVLKETSVVPKTVSGFEANQSNIAPKSVFIGGMAPNLLKESSIAPKTTTTSAFETNQSSVASTTSMVNGSVPAVLKETSAVSKTVSGFETNQSSVAQTSALISGTTPNVLKETSVVPKIVSGSETNQSCVTPKSVFISGTAPNPLKESLIIPKATASAFEANQSSVATQSSLASGAVPIPLKETSVVPKAVSGFETNQSSVVPKSTMVSGTLPSLLKELSVVQKSEFKPSSTGGPVDPPPAVATETNPSIVVNAATIPPSASSASSSASPTSSTSSTGFQVTQKVPQAKPLYIDKAPDFPPLPINNVPKYPSTPTVTNANPIVKSKLEEKDSEKGLTPVKLPSLVQPNANSVIREVAATPPKDYVSFTSNDFKERLSTQSKPMKIYGEVSKEPPMTSFAIQQVKLPEKSKAPNCDPNQAICSTTTTMMRDVPSKLLQANSDLHLLKKSIFNPFPFAPSTFRDGSSAALASLQSSSSQVRGQSDSGFAVLAKSKVNSQIVATNATKPRSRIEPAKSAFAEVNEVSVVEKSRVSPKKKSPGK